MLWIRMSDPAVQDCQRSIRRERSVNVFKFRADRFEYEKERGEISFQSQERGPGGF